MIYPQNLACITWSCVHFDSALDVPATALTLLKYGVRLFSFSALDIDTKEQLLDAIAAAMEFPDYFGRNWDALNDCLGDMMWATRGGRNCHHPVDTGALLPRRHLSCTHAAYWSDSQTVRINGDRRGMEWTARRNAQCGRRIPPYPGRAIDHKCVSIPYSAQQSAGGKY
jgi:hypothetical protein